MEYYKLVSDCPSRYKKIDKKQAIRGYTAYLRGVARYLRRECEKISDHDITPKSFKDYLATEI